MPCEPDRVGVHQQFHVRAVQQPEPDGAILPNLTHPAPGTSLSTLDSHAPRNTAHVRSWTAVTRQLNPGGTRICVQSAWLGWISICLNPAVMGLTLLWCAGIAGCPRACPRSSQGQSSSCPSLAPSSTTRPLSALPASPAASLYSAQPCAHTPAPAPLSLHSLQPHAQSPQLHPHSQQLHSGSRQRPRQTPSCWPG